MLTKEVTLSRSEQFAVLVVHALNDLHNEYCCPECCARCGVLASLLTAGELDGVVNQVPPYVARNPVWQVIGARGKRVNRSWLYSRWDPDRNRCHCIYGPDDSGLDEELPPKRTRKPLGPRTARVRACEVHRQAKAKCTCRPDPAVI
jgi:hypothetical protein